jgi:signal transduction histidine kinase
MSIMPQHQIPFLPSSSSQKQMTTSIPARWLLMARVIWVGAILLLIGFAIVSLPDAFRTLSTPCTGLACTQKYQQLSALEAQKMTALGLTLDTYAKYGIALDIACVLVWVSIAVLLFWRKSDDWVALLVASMLAVVGITYLTDNVLYSVSPWSAPENALYQIKSLALLLALALFPNGRPVPRWSIGIALLYPAYEVIYLVFLRQLHLPDWSLNRNPINALTWWGCSLILVAAQIYRYVRVSTPTERLQTKWVAYGFFIVMVGSFLGTAAENLTPIRQSGPVYLLLNLIILLELLIPLSFAVAILRWHLWDIDILINRTLVYGALTASVIALYVLVVGYLGAVFRTSGNLLISLIAAGLVAVLFQPERQWLQRGVNRLMYGQRDEPYAVVARLGRRLEGTLAPEAVLPAVVETVAQALKLPYAALALKAGDGFQTVAVYGSPVEVPLTLPLTYQAELVGELVLGPRQRGETFTPADRRLLEDLARQVGIAAHAVRLTSDLQRSREQLVTAREEERRRLRRDLHDGLGAALTSLMFKLDATDTLLDRDLQAARTLLGEVRSQMQTSITDIRRLIYNLRPPTLDEWGLVAALREHIAQYALGEVRVTLDAPETLPPLAAAVEVAVYRITLEALANVVKHAKATTCAIRLALVDDTLTVEVQDDGVGRPVDAHAGVGTLAMRERAAELGGVCVIEDVLPHGTRVSASIPLREER